MSGQSILSNSHPVRKSTMKSAKFRIVLVTTPDAKTARKLARLALKARLVACANIIPSVESHYWWRGKLEHGSECLILFKTTAALLKQLETSILAEHPYDTPEFVVLPLTGGNKRYLNWVNSNCLG